MEYMVARHSLRAGLVEPLPIDYTAARCTRGREIGIKEVYPTREEAAAEAERLERHVNEEGCHYRATRVFNA